MEKPAQHTTQAKRKINPEDIFLPSGYRIEVFAADLTTPINIIFNDEGEMFVADSGVTSGNGKVLKYTGGQFVPIAEGFLPPLTGITYYDHKIYVAHRGAISAVMPDGSQKDLLKGLPSWGDHHNNRVVFSNDGKMYFGQGTATNSGVVGEDNKEWVKFFPFFHDYPGADIILKHRDFVTEDFLTDAPYDYTYTGAFAPFGVSSGRIDLVKGVVKASGSILRANPDGSQLELVAWGLRNPFRLKFDRSGSLYATNHGMDVRGSRPVNNSPDEFHKIKFSCWYGWPDYTGGLPVTMPQFKPQDERQPSFLLKRHPMKPPKPFTTFAPHSAAMGFDFNYNHRFGNSGDVFIAEFGSRAPATTGGKPLPMVGHRVSIIDMQSRLIKTFAMNQSGYAASYTGGGGFERPIDVLFGPDDAMYVADFGVDDTEGYGYLPETGVIWRIKKV